MASYFSRTLIGDIGADLVSGRQYHTFHHNDLEDWPDQTEFIMVRRIALWIFFLSASVLIAAGLLAYDKLRDIRSGFRFIAILSVLLILCSCIVWISMVVSPYVTIR